MSPLIKFPSLALITFTWSASLARAVPPAAPTSVVVQWGFNGTLNCSWVDNSNDENGFVIAYRTSASGQFSIFDRVSPNVTTYTGNPTSWPGCSLFNFTIFSVKYDGAGNITEATTGNVISLTAPPFDVYAGKYRSAEVGVPVVWTPSANCPGLTWSASNLPAWLSLNPTTGSLTGTPPAGGTFAFIVNYTAAGQSVVANNLKITVFLPVPATVPPTVTTPLASFTMKLTAPAEVRHLDSFFTDPDVSAASRMVTNMGTLDILYFPTAAPLTVANFQGYVSRNDFSGTLFHRSIPGFVIQGGGYRALAGTPSIPRQAAVLNEPLITNARGTLAMAKSANPSSATSEFFVNLANNASNLNNQNEGFAVFARLTTAGMGVADAIAALQRRNYATENPVLTDCPVLNPPPVSFAPSSLVEVSEVKSLRPLRYTTVVEKPDVCDASVLDGQDLYIGPFRVGSTNITVTAHDLDNLTVSQTFTLNIDEDYASWRWSNTADSEPLADPDGDGVVNLAEFAFGTFPFQRNVAPVSVLSVPVASTNRLAITFPMRRYAPTLTYLVQATDDVAGDWSTVWSSTDGTAHPRVVSGGVSPETEAVSNITISDNQPLGQTAHRFMRVKLIIP